MSERDSCECLQTPVDSSREVSLRTKLILLPVAFMVWWVIYQKLPEATGWLTFDLFSLRRGSQIGEAVAFFLYDVPKVLMLLMLVVFGVGILRSFFTPEKTRAILVGKKESVGNVLASLLGIATPFCTCSAIPLFIGFVEAGVPLGVTLSFLISAPMVNEIALVLLFGLFGWKVAALYLTTGLMIAMVSGWVIGRLHMENYIEDWVREIRSNGTPLLLGGMNWSGRIDYAWQAVKDIVGKVWIYVVAGIAVGAAIHGYVPVGFMASIMGKEAWWSVPLAVIIGVPMYSNAAGIIPVVQALLEKGAALGTVLAFMMAVIGLSLPETIILRKVLKMRLIAVFIGVVTLGILTVGFLFNALL